jgi:prefoldin subunit 5
MEKLIENKGESIITSLTEIIPLIQAVFPVDCMLAVADKEKFIYYLSGKEIDAKVSVGDHIPQQSGLYKCQQTGEKITQILGVEVYGVSTKTCSIPIKNPDGYIIGAFSIGLSVDTQKILNDAVQTIASTAEQISATTEELANTSTKLAQDLDSLRNVGENVIGEINKTSEILKFVNEIASNSNLLGLNAAIEAARAGEHGRGFTVVAGEIRKMADNSSKSVRDINTTLQSIQASVSNMVDTLKEVAEIGEEQASATQEISASMEELTSSAINVERISERVI